MSKIFSLNVSDFVKGLVVAIFGAVLNLLYTMLGNGFSSIDWKSVAQTAILAGISYLMKNYFTDSEGKIVGISLK